MYYIIMLAALSLAGGLLFRSLFDTLDGSDLSQRNIWGKPAPKWLWWAKLIALVMLAIASCFVFMAGVLDKP